MSIKVTAGFYTGRPVAGSTMDEAEVDDDEDEAEEGFELLASGAGSNCCETHVWGLE